MIGIIGSYLKILAQLTLKSELGFQQPRRAHVCHPLAIQVGSIVELKLLPYSSSLVPFCFSVSCDSLGSDNDSKLFITKRTMFETNNNLQ